MVAMSEKILKPPLIEILEPLAARRAVVFTVETGFHQTVIEGDAESVINTVFGWVDFRRDGKCKKEKGVKN